MRYVLEMQTKFSVRRRLIRGSRRRFRLTRDLGLSLTAIPDAFFSARIAVFAGFSRIEGISAPAFTTPALNIPWRSLTVSGRETQLASSSRPGTASGGIWDRFECRALCDPDNRAGDLRDDGPKCGRGAIPKCHSRAGENPAYAKNSDGEGTCHSREGANPVFHRGRHFESMP